MNVHINQADLSLLPSHAWLTSNKFVGVVGLEGKLEGLSAAIIVMVNGKW